MDLHQVKLNLTPKQMKQMAKGRPTQVKADQLNDGKILVSLDKVNYRRYKRAKNNKTGFRVVMNAQMIEGSGFADVLRAVKSGAQKLGAVAVPYVKNLAKSLLPGVRNDINAGLNTGVNFVADKLKSGLSPILGNDITNELIDKGSASVKGFAKDKLDQAQGYLQGLGMKRGQQYKMYGGKLSFDWKKMANILKPIAQIAAPVLASSVGGPAAGVAASMLTDALVGNGAPPLLYHARPNAGKVLPLPKKKTGKKKINGAALMPMGKGRGGALFPM
jgi:hypothetical protein